MVDISGNWKLRDQMKVAKLPSKFAARCLDFKDKGRKDNKINVPIASQKQNKQNFKQQRQVKQTLYYVSFLSSPGGTDEGTYTTWQQHMCRVLKGPFSLQHIKYGRFLFSKSIILIRQVWRTVLLSR